MTISSPAFRNGGYIPRQYSRDGGDKSPPLQISGVPANARSLVLIMDDPDAPSGTYLHWILFNLDPKRTEVREDQVPDEARQGLTDWEEARYGGPQPPSGEHRYFFRLYALDSKLALPPGSTRAQVEAAMQGHIVTNSELMGLYAASKTQPA